MPYQFPRPRVKSNICAIIGAALIAVAAPAAAQACSVATTGEAHVFSSLGDAANYVLVSGSDFRGGSNGWTVSGAAVTSSLAALTFDGDTSALQINPGGSATSPAICVSSATPTFRFFHFGVASSQLRVNLLWNNVLGFPQVTQVGTLSGTGGWTVASPLQLGTALPLWMPGETLSVRVQFVPVGAKPWAIDEIYVDPYSRD